MQTFLLVIYTLTPCHVYEDKNQIGCYVGKMAQLVCYPALGM